MLRPLQHRAVRARVTGWPRNPRLRRQRVLLSNTALLSQRICGSTFITRSSCKPSSAGPSPSGSPAPHTADHLMPEVATMPKPPGISTLLTHAGETPRVDGAAVTPIFQSATFLIEQGKEVRYTRCHNNPSQQVVAAKLAALEGAEAALVFSSGMAAISSTLMSLLQAGDHLLIQSAVYSGTHALVHHHFPRLGITHSQVDIDAHPDTWTPLLTPNTKVLYLEALSNPLVQALDLPATAAWAAAHNLTFVIDATFATPVNLRPLAAGAHLVVHSATKYLNGHSDVIAGVVAGSKQHIHKILEQAEVLGGSLDPHAAFLLQRGLKTLALRVGRQNTNALALATMMEGHPAVARVHYPGLPSHPHHKRVKGVFSGYGGMLAVELKGGVVAAEAMLQALRWALVAVSLGGVETLATRPATTTHELLSPEELAAAGISQGLVRMSCGVEDTEDLVEDFRQALDAGAAAAAAAEAATAVS